MKTLALSVLIASGLCFAAAGESVNAQSLSEKELSDLMNGESSFPVVEFTEGTVIPLKIFLKGDLFRFVHGSSPAKIEVKKTFYVMKREGIELYSTDDMLDWKPFNEFITGSFAFDLNVNMSREGAELTLRADTNPEL